MRKIYLENKYLYLKKSKILNIYFSDLYRNGRNTRRLMLIIKLPLYKHLNVCNIVRFVVGDFSRYYSDYSLAGIYI